MGTVTERRDGTRPRAGRPDWRRWLLVRSRLPAGTRRRLLAVLGAVLLLAASVPLACRGADVDAGTPVPQLVAFLPWLLLPAGGGLLCMAGARWLLGAVWALAVLAVAGWFAVPYRQPGGEPAGPVVARLRVLTANLEFGQATDGLLAALREERPDLVFVQECDRGCVRALRSAPVRARFPYRVVDAGRPAEGSALLSRYPLSERGRVPGRLAMPAATARIAGVRVRLQVAHPMPPVPGSLRDWHAELRRLRDVAAGLRGRPALIAGDFNSSQDHAAFRALLHTGVRDSALALGRSRTPTWPASTSPVLGAQIDHVLTDGPLRPRAIRFLDLAHTDHRAVRVDVELHRP